MLVAEIRLFANTFTPTYYIVVGDVFGTEKVAGDAQEGWRDYTRARHLACGMSRGTGALDAARLASALLAKRRCTGAS
jgi:hypothetical protein